MKAVICTKYGAPEVVQVKEVNKPTPKEDEIVIKIHATSVTSGDARMRRADPFIIRLIFGLQRPRKSILGGVVAGEIEAVGVAVSKFKVGDKVFGTTGMSFGAHAEYVAVSEDATLALKPNNITYEEAAAIPFGATASLHFLRKGKLKEGQKILIYGASGALGTLAIQLAKNFGAEVTAVCSGANADLVKSLGADKVVDYTKEDYWKIEEKFDVVFDTVGKTTISKSLSLLNDKGSLLLASAGICTMLGGSIKSLFISKNIISGVIKETKEDMNYFKKLIEVGHLKAVIDDVFPLEQISLAHSRVDTGHKKGNVIISVEH